MSTKVHDGYITRNGTKLIPFLQKVEKTIDRIREETPAKLDTILYKNGNSDLREKLAFIACDFSRKRGKGGTKLSDNQLITRLRKQRDWMLKNLEDNVEDLRKGMRAPTLDLQVEICVYPSRSPEKEEKILCVVFCENRELKERVLHELELEDYHFQNSADKPEEISMADWRKRERAWETRVGRSSFGEKAWSCRTYETAAFCELLREAIIRLSGKPLQPWKKPWPKSERETCLKTLPWVKAEGRAAQWLKENPGQQSSLSMYMNWHSEFREQTPDRKEVAEATKNLKKLMKRIREILTFKN